MNLLRIALFGFRAQQGYDRAPLGGNRTVNAEVDLRPLAIERRGSSRTESDVGARRHLVSRYVVPSVLLLGAISLIGWASIDLVFPPRSVTVVPVFASRSTTLQKGVPLFQAAGWIEPRPTPVRVAALAPGFVQQLLVVEGQAVKAGETIAQLVREDAALEYQRAQADLRLSRAEWQACEATLAAAKTRFDQPVHLEAVLAEAEAALARVDTELTDLPFEIQRAESNRDFAKRNLEGKTSALNSLAGRAVDRATSEFASAQTLVDELQRRVASRQREQSALARCRDALQKQLELRIDELRAKDEAAADAEAAAARVQQAEVVLAEAKLRLDRMTVVAPVDGRVLHLIACPGSRLMAERGTDESHDASTVVTLYRPDMLQVRVDVRFEDLPNIHVGQAVSITSPAAAAPMRGSVLVLGSEADIQKNTLGVKVAVDSLPDVLKPEMLVDVTFLASATTASDDRPTETMRIYVPQHLIELVEGVAYVWVADSAAGVARRVRVELGHPGGEGCVEVNEGLNMTSRLIASGTDNLRHGERIRVSGEANP